MNWTPKAHAKAQRYKAFRGRPTKERAATPPPPLPPWELVGGREWSIGERWERFGIAELTRTAAGWHVHLVRRNESFHLSRRGVSAPFSYVDQMLVEETT